VSIGYNPGILSKVNTLYLTRYTYMCPDFLVVFWSFFDRS
jgi:hypothetical protein